MEKFFEIGITTLYLLNVVIVFYLVRLAAVLFMEISNYFKLQSAVEKFKSLAMDIKAPFLDNNDTKH